MLTAFAPMERAVGGGVEMVARTLALGLAARGDIELHVVTSRREVSRPGVHRLTDQLVVHTLPRLERFELASLFLHDRWQLGRLLRELRPDVVHTHELGRYGFVCRALGYPYVLTVHGITSVENRILEPRGFKARARRQFQRFVEQGTWRGAARIIANSSYIQGQAPPEVQARLVRIPNPVDPLFFAPETTAPSPDRIVWVGRLSRLKGVDVLLQALPLVRREVPAAHVRLIGPRGDPEFLRQVRQLADQAGPPGCVELVGEHHGEGLRAEYASAAVLAHPSRQDNVPMVIAEAMAVGRPVVAARVGGIPDLVNDGVTGLLCPPEDPEALAKALVVILTDGSRRAALGLAARATACARFDRDAVAGEHARIYFSIAGAGSGARSGSLRPSTTY